MFDFFLLRRRGIESGDAAQEEEAGEAVLYNDTAA